jgi:hypothetical protein
MSEPEVAMFAKIAKKVETATAEPLYGFECVSVDVSHHSYIEAVVISGSLQYPLTLRIPSYLVLAILEFRDTKPPIGFHQ